MQKKILNILSIIFGIGMIVFGANKIHAFLPMPEGMSQEQMDTFGALMKVKWLMPLVAFAEIVGGSLFLLPKTRALGALVILPVMVGIVLHNIIFDPKGLAIAGVLFIINLWVIVVNKERYMHMLK